MKEDAERAFRENIPEPLASFLWDKFDMGKFKDGWEIEFTTYYMPKQFGVIGDSYEDFSIDVREPERAK